MARKFCPACNRLVGGSAVDCECGHVFDSSTVVAVKPPKLCPYCGVGNPQNAQTCHCGRHFDLDPDQSRALVRGRMRSGSIMALVGILGLVGTAAAFVFVGVVTMWPLVGAALVFSNGLRIRFASRRVLDSLPAPLPRAKLIQRRGESDGR